MAERMRMDADALRRSLLAQAMQGPAQHQLHRQYCVYLVALGHGCRAVAGWFGHSPRSVERWVREQRQAQQRLLERPAPAPAAPPVLGRPARLTAEQLQRLHADLAQAPQSLGHPAGPWDGRLLMAHLQSHYQVGLGLRQCQRALRRFRLRAGARLAKAPDKAPDF